MSGFLRFETAQGKIQFLDIRSTNEFETLIRKLRAGVLPACAPVSMQISSISGEKACLRLIELIGWPRYSFTNARYVLLFENIHNDKDGPIDRIRQRFALTQAEGKVAYGIAAGRSLFEIAAQTCTSYETVRTHLRSIYSKCGVNRQAELVALFSQILK